MCGELSTRSVHELRKHGEDCDLVNLSIGDKPAAVYHHQVVLSADVLIDATVTQFAAPELRYLLIGEAPFDSYCFSADQLVDFLRTKRSCVNAPNYPVGPVVNAVTAEPSQGAIYAGRAYMLYSYPTRFASSDIEIKSLVPFLRAHATGDVEWRRVCAAGLECFLGQADVSVVDLAERLCDDPDEVVQRTAKKYMARFRA